MIMDDVYLKLRKRLDDFASGFPETKSGIEIRILKKIFSQDEAELFVNLSPLPETPADTAMRLGLDPDETGKRMHKMADKGLIFRLVKGKSVRYCAVPFVPGIYDFQVNSIDKALAEDVKSYNNEGFGKSIQGHSIPIMRTIPVNRKLAVKWPIAPYDDALRIIEDQKTIAVAPCICRIKSGLLNESCGKPVETCFMFGSQAAYYVDNHMGRYIGKEEAARIITENEKAGLVLQPFNAKNTGVMCSCCGDCCEMLGSLKRQPSPAASVKSNYFAAVETESCSCCGTCIGRCQMDAVNIDAGAAYIDLNRCIGCGLCVSTCPDNALSLIRKKKEDLYHPPETKGEMFLMLAMERNKNPLL